MFTFKRLVYLLVLIVLLIGIPAHAQDTRVSEFGRYEGYSESLYGVHIWA